MDDFDEKNREFYKILHEIAESFNVLRKRSGADSAESFGDDTYEKISCLITFLKTDRGWIEFCMRQDKRHLSAEIETSREHLGKLSQAIARLRQPEI